MRISKVWINRSIQNRKEVRGRFYVVLGDEIVRIWVTPKMVVRDDDWSMRFEHKYIDYMVYHDLDRHLVCHRAWFTGSSLMFKNFWFAHGYRNKLKR